MIVGDECVEVGEGTILADVFADSVSGKTIKPVLIIDKDYQPGD